MRLPSKGAPWIVIPLLPLIVGCASTTHYVEVYVTGSSTACILTADMGGDKIDGIYVFPKDVIVWVNATSGNVDFSFKPGAIEAASMTLAPGKRLMTPVIATAAASVGVSVVCASGGSSGPKIVVGDPP